MNYILYCCINSVKISIETIYSIRTLSDALSNKDDIRIVIVTDKRSFIENELRQIKNLEQNKVLVEEIDENQIKSWLGESRYVFRLKTKCLQYFFSKYEGNVLFVDSDTFYISDLDKIFLDIQTGAFIMDRSIPVKELVRTYRYIFGNDVWLSFNDDAERFLTVLEEKKQCALSTNYSFYSSGKIGIHYQHKNILNDILDCMDNIYSTTQIHIAEELANSNILQMNHHNIIVSKNTFYHYAHYKDLRLFIGFLLNHFVERDEEYFKSKIIRYHINQYSLQYDELPYLSLYLNSKETIGQMNDNQMLLHAIACGLPNTAIERSKYLDYINKM